MQHHVFLSYSRKDADLMHRVRDDLQALGLTVWTDEGTTLPTPLWHETIEKALNDAGCMVIILTPNALNSSSSRDEIRYAKNHHIAIYPLLAAGDMKNAVPLPLIGTQWIDIRDANYSKGIWHLTTAMLSYLDAKASIESPPPTPTHKAVPPASQPVEIAGVDANKSVFISYRRHTSKYPARLIYDDLTRHGYDAFFDVNTLDNGTFDTVILNEIAARSHFVVILSPGSLARCVLPDGTENREDWLRIEIEQAIDLQRNIVPVLEEGFSFEAERQYLTGKLSQLPRYNGPKLVHEYFEAAMESLRTRFLK